MIQIKRKWWNPKMIFNEKSGKTNGPVQSEEYTFFDLIHEEDSGQNQEDRHDDMEDIEEQVGEAEQGCVTSDEEDSSKQKLRNRDKLKRPVRFSEYEVNFVEYEPDSYQEAVTGPDREEWKQAVQEELEAHKKNKTWTIVPREENQRLIDSRWVFKIQFAGTSTKYKARLCARGFNQRYGINYSETFAPVVRYDSIRTLLAIVAH